MTGERELDRIIAALNHAGERLADARREKDGLNRQVAAADRLAAIGRLAAAFAHEIRNPIAAMRLKAENALADESRQQLALRTIIEQVDRLDRLVHQMLSVSSKEIAKPVAVPMLQFLEETVRPYRDLAAAKGVALDVQTGIDKAHLDPALTRRAIDNLITNAIEHSSAGSWVRLAVRNGGGRIVIAVEDEGTGIAPELADTLFEPFVSGRSEGTGLGLAIAREAVAGQGGALRLVPSERGAIFEIELPG
jgi:signal transduction histidine kinase